MNKTFNITNLVHPAHLSTSILDTDTKKYILSQYNTFLNNKRNTLNTYEINIILDSLKHMRLNDDTVLDKKFKEYNLMLDLYRNESFESVYPEFAKWYNNI